MKHKNNDNQLHLRVYEDRSEYHATNGCDVMFVEGTLSNAAKKRIITVKNSFKNGFLVNLITGLLYGTEHIDEKKISMNAQNCVNRLADSLTSEVGRAIIGLTVMQLCVKTITPDQSIRLHKGSSITTSFSWVEGISMRTLDKKYVTPILRQYDLLRLNADGFMMTRSLAENYPYTLLYKANLRGAKKEWLILVEEVEGNKTSAIETLKLLLSKLINMASVFTSESDALIEQVEKYLQNPLDCNTAMSLMIKHLEQSDYAARLLEINMHALMYNAIESGGFGDMEIKPLSQMRSANKKHGNIGDIELLEDGQIVESWDAKYGKGYLRDEIEEAIDKLQNHDFVRTVGFVTNVPIIQAVEIRNRCDEIEQLYSIRIQIIEYHNWVNYIYKKVLDMGIISESVFSHNWITTYCEYLSQKKRDIAPIDEPCIDWVQSLRRILISIA